jgi:hypothetical protein
MKKTWLLPTVATQSAAPEAGLAGHPYSIHLYFSHFLAANHYFTFHKYTGTSTLPFRALIEDDVEASCGSLIVVYVPGIFLQGLRKTMKT